MHQACKLQKSDIVMIGHKETSHCNLLFFSELADSDMLNVINNLFVFQPNENSKSIYVALLLCAALKGHNVKIISFLNVDIPFKKKGQQYQTDYIVFQNHKPSTESTQQ